MFTGGYPRLPRRRAPGRILEEESVPTRHDMEYGHRLMDTDSGYGAGFDFNPNVLERCEREMDFPPGEEPPGMPLRGRFPQRGYGREHGRLERDYDHRDFYQSPLERGYAETEYGYPPPDFAMRGSRGAPRGQRDHLIHQRARSRSPLRGGVPETFGVDFDQYDPGPLVGPRVRHGRGMIHHPVPRPLSPHGQDGTYGNGQNRNAYPENDDGYLDDDDGQSNHSHDSDFDSKVIQSDPVHKNDSQDGYYSEMSDAMKRIFDHKSTEPPPPATNETEKQLMLLVMNQRELIEKQQQFLNVIQKDDEGPSGVDQTTADSHIAKAETMEAGDHIGVFNEARPTSPRQSRSLHPGGSVPSEIAHPHVETEQHGAAYHEDDSRSDMASSYHGNQRERDRNKSVPDEDGKIYKSTGETVELEWRIPVMPSLVPVEVSKVDGPALFTAYWDRVELHQWYKDRITYTGDTIKGLIRFSLEKLNFVDQGVYVASYVGIGNKFYGPSLVIKTDIKDKETAPMYWVIPRIPEGGIVTIYRKYGPTLFRANGKSYEMTPKYFGRVKFNGDTAYGLISFNLYRCKKFDSGYYMAMYGDQEFEGRYLEVSAGEPKPKPKRNKEKEDAKKDELKKKTDDTNIDDEVLPNEDTDFILMRDVGLTAFMYWKIPPQTSKTTVTIRKKMGSTLMTINGSEATVTTKYVGRVSFSGDTTEGRIKFTLKDLEFDDRGTYLACFNGREIDGKKLMITVTLYVGNLPNFVKVEAIKNFFEENGINVVSRVKHNARISQYGFVKCNCVDFDRALSLDGFMFENKHRLEIRKALSFNRLAREEEWARDREERHADKKSEERSDDRDTRRKSRIDRERKEDRRTINLFIGNLPNNTSSNAVSAWFKEKGLNIKLGGRRNDLNKNFTFIKCAPEDFEKVMKLDGAMFNDEEPIKIDPARNRDSGTDWQRLWDTKEDSDDDEGSKQPETLDEQKNAVYLYVGNLPRMATNKEIKRFLKEAAVDAEIINKGFLETYLFVHVRCNIRDLYRGLGLNGVMFNGKRPVQTYRLNASDVTKFQAGFHPYGTIPGTTPVLKPEETSKTVTISNLPVSYPTSYLKNLFNQKEIKTTEINRRTMSPNAYVDLASEIDVRKAEKLAGEEIDWCNKIHKIKVKRSQKQDSQSESNQGTRAETNTDQSSQSETAVIVVGNLPLSYPETHLRYFFQEKQINISKIQMTPNSKYAHVVLAYQEDMSNALLLNGDIIFWDNQHYKITIQKVGEVTQDSFQKPGEVTQEGSQLPQPTSYDNSEFNYGNESTLWVGNLSLKVFPSEVKKFFYSKGIPVSRVYKVDNERYALVDLINPSQVNDALALDGERFAKHRLKVRLNSDRKSRHSKNKDKEEPYYPPNTMNPYPGTYNYPHSQMYLS